jgi:hypothetical protein
MKKFLFISIFFTVAMANGQQINDTIETVHVLGTGFRLQGDNLSPRRLLEVMQSKPRHLLK